MDPFEYFHTVILCCSNNKVEFQPTSRKEVLQAGTNQLISHGLIALAFQVLDKQVTRKNSLPSVFLPLLLWRDRNL